MDRSFVRVFTYKLFFNYKMDYLKRKYREMFGKNENSESKVIINESNLDGIADVIYQVVKPVSNPPNIPAFRARNVSYTPLTLETFKEVLVEVFSGRSSFAVIKEILKYKKIFRVDKIDLESIMGYDANDIILGKKIAEGANGKIHLVKYFKVGGQRRAIDPIIAVGKETILYDITKYPRDRHDDVVDENIKIENNFIEETITSILLWAYHTQMQIYIGKNFPQPFPEILSLDNTTDDTNNHTIMSVMEKLDFDGWRFFDKKEYEGNRIYSSHQLPVLIQIVYYFYCLQQSCGFTHGDMHLGNIMFKKIKEYEPKFSITIEGKNIESDYRPYIIDLGMSCVDLSKCCNLTSLHIKGGAYKTDTYCRNKSQDMRLFFFCLYHYCAQHDKLYDKLNEYVKWLFSASCFDVLKCRSNIYNKIIHDKEMKSINEGRQFTEFHAFYADVENIDDPTFYPENILKGLLTL